MSRTDIGTTTRFLKLSPSVELGLELLDDSFVDGDTIGCIIVFSEGDRLIGIPGIEINDSRFCTSFDDIYRDTVYNTTFKINFFSD